MQITIDYRFTSLNDYIDAERTNRHIAAKIKKEETEIVRLSSLGKSKVRTYPLDVVFQWFRKDTRTDPDNIAFSQKFILDGLAKAGIIEGDGWKHIRKISHEFYQAPTDYVIVDLQ